MLAHVASLRSQPLKIWFHENANSDWFIEEWKKVKLLESQRLYTTAKKVQFVTLSQNPHYFYICSLEYLPSYEFEKIFSDAKFFLSLYT